MDKLDFRILKKLLDDSRLSFRKIAEELEVSTDTVIRRYKQLKKSGAIKPIVSIDVNKLGYQASVWYMISLESNVKLSYFIDKLVKIPNMLFVIKAIGDYDILAIAIVKSFQQMFKIGDELAKIAGVKKIEGRPYIGRDPERTKAFFRGFYKAENLSNP